METEEQFDFFPEGTNMLRMKNRVIFTFSSEDEAIIFEQRLRAVERGGTQYVIGVTEKEDK